MHVSRDMSVESVHTAGPEDAFAFRVPIVMVRKGGSQSRSLHTGRRQEKLRDNAHVLHLACWFLLLADSEYENCRG